jgi:transcriptional regulator with XRE-family HTH domain
MQTMDADEQLRRHVGARIRQARHARGLSQAELARLLPGSVESTYISRWERGENIPSWPHLQALASALGTTIAWFLENGPG